MIYLGTNIKENRLKRGYTQEQLAYELGVSSQTVSRWENGTTYPDIAMLPVLADSFNISIDKLVGYAKECSTEEREIFFKSINHLEMRERILPHREMLEKYPNNVYLQFSLANILYGILKKNSDIEVEKEINLLCHRILQSDKPGIQCGALRLLALLSARHGDTETAMKYVNELPSLYCGREIMAEKILNKVNAKDAIKKIAQI